MSFPTSKSRQKVKRLSDSISMHGNPVQTQYISQDVTVLALHCSQHLFSTFVSNIFKNDQNSSGPAWIKIVFFLQIVCIFSSGHYVCSSFSLTIPSEHLPQLSGQSNQFLPLCLARLLRGGSFPKDSIQLREYSAPQID